MFRMMTLFASTAFLFWGCATTNTGDESRAQPADGSAAQTDQMQTMGQHHAAAMCPLMVEGTTVRATEVEGGAALSFTTTGDVDDLRRRVKSMAGMHNRRHARGCPMMQEPGRGQGPQGGGAHMGGARTGDTMGQQGKMTMMSAEARAEEIEGGAQLVYTPKDPNQLNMLRQQMARRAQMMAKGRCPMMSGTAPATQKETPEADDAN